VHLGTALCNTGTSLLLRLQAQVSCDVIVALQEVLSGQALRQSQQMLLLLQQALQ